MTLTDQSMPDTSSHKRDKVRKGKGRKPSESKPGPGRPTIYSDEISLEVCQRIAMREPLSKICSDPRMPCETTIYNWKFKHPEFMANYARAREHRADARADAIDDYMELLKAGKLDPHAARVLIDAEKWQAGKENAKRYSDIIRAEVTGSDGKDLMGGISASLDWIKRVLTEPATNPVRLVEHEPLAIPGPAAAADEPAAPASPRYHFNPTTQQLEPLDG